VSPREALRDNASVAVPRKTLISAAVAYLARLRFPVLFGITAGLFLLDLVVPDFVPAVDEILLGLATALFASWRKRHEERGSTDSSKNSSAAKP
jgi:hypothetical protein